MPTITYRQQMVKARGKLYGPYWYSEWKENGRVRTRYHGKDKPPAAPPNAGSSPATRPSLYHEVDRTREAWLLLGYNPELPELDRAKVRKRVWNYLASARPDGHKAEIKAAWDYLCTTIRWVLREGHRKTSQPETVSTGD